jgi:hypothetical protein
VVRRTIVTSQPEIACDVCARRLLRGEHAEVFLTGGRRCNVCELCAPRAAHEGWKREIEFDTLGDAPLRPRRGRSLLGRLRRGYGPAEVAGAARRGDRSPRPVSQGAGAEEPYDFLGGAVEPVPEPEAQTAAGNGSRAGATAVATRAPDSMQRAIEIFNRGEYPRRLAGVARSLGVPEVSIHRADPLSREVGIVVAWELCWYRYAVDISADGGEARALGQGTTLDELTADERLANGAIDERGALSLARL